MSTLVFAVAEEVSDVSVGLADRPLSELAEIANHRHTATVESARATLNHAIAAGEAILAAHEQVGRGKGTGWTDWVAENLSCTLDMSRRYERLAFYRDEVEQALENGFLAPGRNGGLVMASVRYLAGLPAVGGAANGVRYPQSTIDEARFLVEAGMTNPEAADELGVSAETVRGWTRDIESLTVKGPMSADQRQKRELAKRAARRARLARKALRRQEREQAVKRHGGNVSEAYSMIRRLSQVLDRAVEDQTDTEFRSALTRAMAKCNSLEDEIVRAVGLA